MEISYLLGRGYKKLAIAQAVNRAYSSIWDEISQNSVNGKYDARKSHHKAYVRRKYAKYQGMKIVENVSLRQKVEDWLLAGQSPEAVSGRIENRERDLPKISKNSVRRFIKSPYGRKIEFIRSKLKKRKRGRQRRPKIKDKRSIHSRPASIESRKDVGDCEGDFLVSGKSGQGVIFVAVDLRLRYKFLERILRPCFNNLKQAGERIKKRFPEWQSMTTDSDLLFAKHKELEKIWGILIYFCDIHSPWQKATIENANKEIRQYIPKSSDISKYSRYRIKKIETKLNDKFMKCLNYRTPAEALAFYRKRKTRQRSG